jgi:hypothetical protein
MRTARWKLYERRKGRAITFIEEIDGCVPLPDLVIPNDLDDAALSGYVSKGFTAFRTAGQALQDVLP